MRSGAIANEIRSFGCRAGPAPNKNIENNPMHSREPLAKKGVAGMDALTRKNILTRRANQGHNSIIPNFGKSPVDRLVMAGNNG